MRSWPFNRSLTEIDLDIFYNFWLDKGRRGNIPPAPLDLLGFMDLFNNIKIQQISFYDLTD